MSLLRNAKMESLAQPLAIALVAFIVGYKSRPLLSRTFGSSSTSSGSGSSASNKKRKIDSAISRPVTPSVGASDSGSDEGTDTDSDAEDEAAALATDMASVKASLGEEVKLVLVVNDSLKMTKGKIAAQAGHATLACALTLKEQNPRLFKKWQAMGQPKIALRCGTTEEIDDLAAQARKLNLCARTIQDAGRTQVAPGSKTVLGIGPCIHTLPTRWVNLADMISGPARLINAVTGKLKLL